MRTILPADPCRSRLRPYDRDLTRTNRRRRPSLSARFGAFLGRLGGAVRDSAPWREWTGRALEPLDGPPPVKAMSVTRTVVWRIEADGTVRRDTTYAIHREVGR